MPSSKALAAQDQLLGFSSTADDHDDDEEMQRELAEVGLDAPPPPRRVSISEPPRSISEEDDDAASTDGGTSEATPSESSSMHGGNDEDSPAKLLAAGPSSSDAPAGPSTKGHRRMRSEGTARRMTMPPQGSAEQEKQLGVHRFNEKPKAGIKHLLDTGVLRGEPRDVADFLRHAKGLSKRRIGDYLGERGEFEVAVLGHYIALFDFGGMAFVEAVRAFLAPFRLPGEAQKIDRIMCEFAAKYCEQNDGVFANADAAYVLGFSVIMLNTDAHSSQIKDKMKKEEFVRNNRGINDGADLPTELLEAVFDDIQAQEIKTGTEFDDLGESELLEWLARGTVFKKFPYSRMAASRAHACRLWIQGDHLCYTNLSSRSKLVKTVALEEVSEVQMGAASEAFARQGVTEETSEGTCFSLVLRGRTLDLQASSKDEVGIWARYFRQVIERSQLEEHARAVAMRAQPRERFLEMATLVWKDEVLGSWEAECRSRRTLMLWWEGIPSALRGRVWALVIGDPLGLAETEGPRRPSGGPGFSAYERHLTMATAADEKAAEAAISREWEALGLTGEGREELRMFTAAGSPMHLALVQLLTAVYAYTRAGGPAPTSHSSLLAAMLLLYCDGAGAFVCLAALLRDHFVGVRPDAHAQWRMRAGGAVISKELPELDAHLSAVGVAPIDYLPQWLGTLFMCTLSLDAAARVWDVYLRDGELFAWRAALEVLRLLGPALLEVKEKAEVLELLAHAAARGGVTERALFHGIAANEACASYFTEQFAQKVGLEQAGRCYDLYANSYLADPAEIEKAAREAEPIAFGASEKKAMVRRKGSK